MVFILLRPVSSKKQENGSGKQRSLHAPLKGDKINVAIACGLGGFVRIKVISNFFFYVGFVCLLQSRCRFLTI